jgi:hypothetical protein
VERRRTGSTHAAARPPPPLDPDHLGLRQVNVRPQASAKTQRSIHDAAIIRLVRS